MISGDEKNVSISDSGRIAPISILTEPPVLSCDATLYYCVNIGCYSTVLEWDDAEPLIRYTEIRVYIGNLGKR